MNQFVNDANRKERHFKSIIMKLPRIAANER